jgi:hypothetical protein
MANYNYIKENSLVFSKMIYGIIDGTDTTKWRNEEHRNEFKYGIVSDYFKGIRELLVLDLPENSSLNSHKLYAESFFKLCERYKIEGEDCYKGKEDRHLEVLCEKIEDWIQNGILELRALEKKHYTKLAFDYRDNPTIQQPNHLQQLKHDAALQMSRNKNPYKVNFG